MLAESVVDKLPENPTAECFQTGGNIAVGVAMNLNYYSLGPEICFICKIMNLPQQNVIIGAPKGVRAAAPEVQILSIVCSFWEKLAK